MIKDLAELAQQQLDSEAKQAVAELSSMKA